MLNDTRVTWRKSRPCPGLLFLQVLPPFAVLLRGTDNTQTLPSYQKKWYDI